ncbi:MAG TPA: hypothetical protein VMT37_09525 [Solirubrobacterales bacterium]|nr:hypothetical protein [Solirubrobacterales bacterium]
MKRISRRLTYANVVATLALVLVVVGGSAYAASQLAKNSVGSKQIKKGAVTTAKIKKGAVTGAKVAGDTITGRNVDESSLGQVPDAKTLDGLGASAFTRQAHAFSTEGFPLRKSGANTVSVDIVAPQNGFLLAIGSGSMRAGPGIGHVYFCGLTIDGVPNEESWRFLTLSQNEEDECGTNAIFPVTAGKHTLKLGFFSGLIEDELSANFSELDVVFIPLAG